MSDIPDSVSKASGSLTNLPFPDNSFDYIFAIESLEHAVNIQGALREFRRVLAPNGKLLIIDKNSRRIKAIRFKLPEWETWFTKKQLCRELISVGFKVSIVDDVPYENGESRLFSAWVGVLEK
jgi:malonyl-CoA O-methyltransferase